MLAKAVAAMHGAGFCRHQEGPPFIFMEQFLALSRREIPDGIRSEPRMREAFLLVWDELTEDGVVERPFFNFLCEAKREVQGEAGSFPKLLFLGIREFKKGYKRIETRKILSLNLTP